MSSLHALILCAGAALLCSPCTAIAHPTNGHLCTEISSPIRCFNSDGFCEWVVEACLYRCDLHDTQSDCEQIKDGCGWTNNTCLQTPTNTDVGIRSDAHTLNLVDAFSDAFIDTNDSVFTDGRLDISDVGVRAAQTDARADASSAGGVSTGSSQPNCHSGATNSFVQWSLVGMLLLLVRARPC